MFGSFYEVKKELMKSDLLADFVNDKYKGDIGYAIADNPFILEAIENAILKEFPEIAATWNS